MPRKEEVTRTARKMLDAAAARERRAGMAALGQKFVPASLGRRGASLADSIPVDASPPLSDPGQRDCS